jgi:hypothetical protein
MSRGREDFVERLPKAARAVTDGDFQSDLEATAFRRGFAPIVPASSASFC